MERNENKGRGEEETMKPYRHVYKEGEGHDGKER